MENSEQNCTLLSEETMRNWFNGYLSPFYRYSFQNHLSECSECRGKMAKMLRDFRFANCVEKKFISSWIKGWTTPIKTESFRKHITICYECRNELATMLNSWPRDEYLD